MRFSSGKIFHFQCTTIEKTYNFDIIFSFELNKFTSKQTLQNNSHKDFITKYNN